MYDEALNAARLMMTARRATYILNNPAHTEKTVDVVDEDKRYIYYRFLRGGTPAIGWLVKNQYTLKTEETRKTMINHPEPILKLLEQASEIEGRDMRQCYVYGSPNRPMGFTWARIPDTMFLNAPKSETGFHSYVIALHPLDEVTLRSYELVPVSPAPPKPAKVSAIRVIELECGACGGPCIDHEIGIGSYLIDYDVERVKCERCGTVQPVPSGIFDLSNVRFRKQQ